MYIYYLKSILNFNYIKKIYFLYISAFGQGIVWAQSIALAPMELIIKEKANLLHHLKS